MNDVPTLRHLTQNGRMPQPISLTDMERTYEERIQRPLGQPAESFLVEAANGEIVSVTLGLTVRFAGFTTVPSIPELGVVVEPANLPSDLQTWGRRFEGPAWPAWSGLRSAIDAMSNESADIRARIL